MKKSVRFVQIAMLAGVLGIVSLVMTGACLAGSIVAVHGHSGNIEYQDRVLNTDRQKLGWGLDIEQKPGLYNWLHYSIPTVPLTKTRYLLVRYQTGIPGETADSMITSLHVYDGENLIYFKDGLSLTGGPAITVIDMEEEKTISWGLGLSIGIGAGVESMSHAMRIYAVWAEWH